jgi:glutamate racemase
MLGILDSGKGGLLTLRHIRRIHPNTDVVFLADSMNAPYGTKSEDELTGIVTAGIERLYNVGATKILLACCSACTVYKRLDRYHQIRTISIIDPIADEAAKGNRIGLIATERTVSSGIFNDALAKHGKHISVSVPLAELVTMTENGLCDENVKECDRKKLTDMLSPLIGVDTLILGCTHFPLIINTIESITGARAISSAYVGALRSFG